MKRKTILERLIYGVIIVLSLLALWLVIAAKTQFASTKPVYQGF